MGSRKIDSLAPLALAVAFLLGAAAIWLSGPPLGHSLRFNLTWIEALMASFENGWSWRRAPEMWRGLGGLDFFFYAPLSLVTAAGAGLILGGAVQGLLASGVLFFGLSLASAYGLGRCAFERVGALTVAVVYAFAYYHLAVNWFVRQAAAEFAAMAFLPLLALGMIRVLRAEGGIAAFAFGLAGIVWSHLPSALLAAHVFCVSVLLWLFLRRGAGAWPALARLLGASALAAALSAPVWLPVVALFGDTALRWLDVMNPLTWFLPLPLAEPWSLTTFLSTHGTITFAYVLLFLILVLRLAAPRKSVAAREDAAFFAVGIPPGVIALALALPISAPIWESWTISRVQFPFRLLAFGDLTLALAFAGLLLRLRGTGLWPAALRAASCGMAILLVLLTLVVIVSRFPGGQEQLAVGAAEGGAQEYLPVEFQSVLESRLTALLGEDAPFSAMEAMGPAVAAAIAEDAGAESRARIIADEGRRVEVALEPGLGPALVPIPWWPHWHAATAEGRALETVADPGTGLLLILNPPPEASRALLTLPLFKSERLGWALMLLGLAFVLCHGLSTRPRLHGNAGPPVPRDRDGQPVTP